MISRRRFLATAGGSVVAGQAAFAQATAPIPFMPPRLRPPQSAADHSAARSNRDTARALIDSFDLRGQTICAVIDVKTGALLEHVDGQSTLPPASVAKAATAIYALDVLGPDHRFATRLMATGPIQNGRLDGDLILSGGADPTLDTADLATLAGALQHIGLTEVRGRFMVHDGALPYASTIDSGQPAHVGYAPAVSGIALNFNRVFFEWTRTAKGYSVTMDARVRKFRPEVAMATMQVVDRNAPVYLYRRTAQNDQWSVAKSALSENGGRWLPVRAPAAYAGDVFATLARSNGVKLPVAQMITALPASADEIARFESAPLAEITTDMLKFSTNLTAEMVGMSATSQAFGRPGSMGFSAEKMNNWLQRRYAMIGVDLVDHSGLGGQSRLSPVGLAMGLAAAGRTGILRPMLKPFPLRDANGRQIQNPAIAVDAKTGTLNFVSGLGGYMTTPKGRELAFGIFSADLATRNRLLPHERERPAGGRSWNRKSKWLQQGLIERWAEIF
jgi:D-alanyl-D-alanine carboxypeptidase/D-alanyl-D-alanine-endopeptidase (penicillin-binding protein 4)